MGNKCSGRKDATRDTDNDRQAIQPKPKTNEMPQTQIVVEKTEIMDTN